MQHISTSDPIQAAADSLVSTISSKLSGGQRVLWLLSGGSSLKIASIVASQIEQADLNSLYITMTDERYGPIGHANENWQLMLNDGFSLTGAETYRVLSGKSRTETTADFNDWLDKHIKLADYKLAVFGIGSDGHTAGIKPGSRAIESNRLAADFTGDDFERITITPKAVALLDEAVIQVSGHEKASQLQDLISKSIPISRQPAQILKAVPKATIHTDIDISFS